MSVRLGVWLVACNVGVCAALVLTSLASLRDSREADEAVARQTAVNLANSLSIEIGAEIRLIDNALATVAFDVAQADTDTEREASVTRSVSEQTGLLPHVDALRYADVDGSSPYLDDLDKEPVIISHRAYFQDAKQTDSMVVSEPLLNLVTNEWCIILARRLLTKQGDFYGIVYAIVTAEHFIDRFSLLDMGESGAVSLRTSNLRLIARWASQDPSSMKGVGEVVVSQEMLLQLAENPYQGSYITPTALDNVERVTAFQRVRDYPLIVFTGLATQEFLVSWRRDVLRQSLLVVFIVIVTAGFSTYLYIRQHRERRKRHLAVQIAREQSLMLENDLVGMIRVRDRVNVWENKAAHRIFGYEPGELRGQSARLLYLDDETYARVGEAYAKLQRDGRFGDQIQMRRKDGQPIWIDLSGAFVSLQESLWMMVDIDALKRSEALATNLALRDPLTGLANRRLLDVQLENAVANARRHQTSMAVCYLDLDGFKQINDVHGHDAGDEVLRATGRQLLATVRGTDTVARLGGDEFAVVLSPVGDITEAVEVMTRCLERIREGIHLDSGVIVYVDASMGIVMGNGESESTGILRAADEAMYAAKRAGKGRIHVA